MISSAKQFYQWEIKGPGKQDKQQNLQVMGQKYAILNAMVNFLRQLEIPARKLRMNRAILESGLYLSVERAPVTLSLITSSSYANNSLSSTSIPVKG